MAEKNTLLTDVLSIVDESNVEKKKRFSDIEAGERIKAYNFKKPEKFSKEHIRSLQMIYESYARLNSNFLATLLRIFVEIKLVSIDQFTYEECCRNIEDDSCLAIVNMEPLRETSLIEMSKNTTFVILDRLLGGDGKLASQKREYTDIERTVLENIIAKILIDVKEAWSNIIEINPRFSDIETNIQFAQIVPPNDIVISVAFKIKIGDTNGKINMIIPYIMLEPIISKLSVQYLFMKVKRIDTFENVDLLKNHLYNRALDLSIEVDRFNINFKDIMQIKKNDVIPLNRMIKEDISIYVGGVLKYKCRAGKVDKNQLAVKITTIVDGVNIQS